MGQDIGSQQLRPSGARCQHRDKRPLPRLPRGRSAATHTCIRQLSLRPLEHSSLGTHLSNLGLQLSHQTTDQPGEPAHSLFERLNSLFNSSTSFRGLPAPRTSLTAGASRKRSTTRCRVSRCSIGTQLRGNHVVQHLTLPPEHVEAQPLGNVRGKTQVGSVIPLAYAVSGHADGPRKIPLASRGNVHPSDRRQALDQTAPCKRHRSQTICPASMCILAHTHRATCSGFIHAASVLHMKGLERLGYAVRVDSVRWVESHMTQQQHPKRFQPRFPSTPKKFVPTRGMCDTRFFEHECPMQTSIFFKKKPRACTFSWTPLLPSTKFLQPENKGDIESRRNNNNNQSVSNHEIRARQEMLVATRHMCHTFFRRTRKTPLSKCCSREVPSTKNRPSEKKRDLNKFTANNISYC